MSKLFVPGQGPPFAKGMIVGEAPGFEEEKALQPFVGNSGKFLFLHLAPFGLYREDLYVTNVVKTVPLDGMSKIRRPNEEEIAMWSDYLVFEIQLQAPAAILCLGRTAVDRLMPPGTEFGKQEGTLFSAWHPAHLLYHESETRDTQKLLEWINQLRPFAEAVLRDD